MIIRSGLGADDSIPFDNSSSSGGSGFNLSDLFSANIEHLIVIGFGIYFVRKMIGSTKKAVNRRTTRHLRKLEAKKRILVLKKQHGIF